MQSEIHYGILTIKRGGVIMSVRSANVMARVEPEIKAQAEAIIAQLGLTASSAINMFYRQIIQEQALPFQPRVVSRHPGSVDEMDREEFDTRMAIGYSQAINGDDFSLDEAFDDLLEELSDGR